METTSQPTLKERGASIVEYAFVVILIAIVALVAVTLAGEELSETYSEIASTLDDAN
jgi:Flp pilus assembly pilin Flp